MPKFTLSPDICVKCKRSFPRTIEFFPPQKKAHDGLRHTCRECWRAENRARLATPEGKALKAASRKRRDPAKVAAEKKRSHERHKEQDNARARKWHKDHIERARANAKADYETNKPARIRQAMLNTQRRMARKRALPDTLTDTEWQYALDHFSQNGVICCAICGRPRGFFHTIVMDHWIPLAASNCPGTVAKNIIPLCHGYGGCNNEKSDRDPHEWLLSKYSTRKAAEIEAAIQSYFDSIDKQA